MNNSRNVNSARPGLPPTADEVAAELGIRPLNARSVVLSALLGSHPPELPVAALVELGAVFQIPSGTLRTALSRMAAAGEVAVDAGRYRLAGRLLARQREQDAGRVDRAGGWDGHWWSATIGSGGRPVAERRRLRSAMAGARMGELRPGTWMRPANIEVTIDDVLADRAGILLLRGELRGGDPARLAARLWALDAIEARAGRLDSALSQATDWLAAGEDAAVAPAFTAFAACLQFLRTEPQLPIELSPSPAARSLRADYVASEPALQARLRAIYVRALSTAGP